jgi:hypothetical protein
MGPASTTRTTSASSDELGRQALHETYIGVVILLGDRAGRPARGAEPMLCGRDRLPLRAVVVGTLCRFEVTRAGPTVIHSSNASKKRNL